MFAQSAFVLMAFGPAVLLGEQVDPVVQTDLNGALHYAKDALGNRVPDFSSAGYRGGGEPIPKVPTVYIVEPTDGDDAVRIQTALDALATRKADRSGVRGAVQLADGSFEVADSLHIPASGIVLRGSGGTTIVATGKGRRTLIKAFGINDRNLLGTPVAFADDYAPVGDLSLQVEDASSFSVGDRVLVQRPGTPEWIEAVGMAHGPARTPYKWRPGQADMYWDRTVVAIAGDLLTFDAPLTTALEKRFGGGTVQRYDWPGRLQNVGVEHLQLISEHCAANPQDEEHAWMAIQFDNIEDAWVAGISGRGFASSLVDLGAGARAVTVQDCESTDPVSERVGYRRHSFHTSGQQTLFLRCSATDGQNDFTAGYFTTGPNVFLDCASENATGFSGSIGSWASGLLFDNVDSNGSTLRFDNLEIWNGGVGWSVANSMIWKSRAGKIICRQPPTATNWANGVWAQFVGDGLWMQTSEMGVHPDSLYRAQLIERAGTKACAALDPLSLARASHAEPAPAPSLSSPPPASPALTLENGWLVRDGALLIGREESIQWWRGSMLPAAAARSGSSLTRFAPGRSGRGLTDDLSELAETMEVNGRVVLRHHYGLWYDRRRDDHEMTKRIDGDVWPPFFELPFARTGTDGTWNGLTDYDLTQYNPWYFSRLQEFAGEARKHGLVLINEMYFQHNIIESGAHWVDFPWRPENAVQDTDFPEPPAFDGDTIKMADRFYDVTHPERREWHRLYIRRCLENLENEPNVIHTISAENTGPLHFMQFWLDVVGEWQAETGYDPLIGLSAPKNVQDAILEDPTRRGLIDAIDLTYWFVDRRGELFAPDGGHSLAPRQELRKWKGKRPDGASVAGMVSDYRERFPSIAVISGLGEIEGWSFVAAGGSLAPLPKTTEPELLRSLARMSPLSNRDDQWMLGSPDEAYFYYTLGESPAMIDLRSASGTFRLVEINLKTGTPTGATAKVEGGSILRHEGNGRKAYWILR